MIKQNTKKETKICTCGTPRMRNCFQRIVAISSVCFSVFLADCKTFLHSETPQIRQPVPWWTCSQRKEGDGRHHCLRTRPQYADWVNKVKLGPWRDQMLDLHQARRMLGIMNLGSTLPAAASSDYICISEPDLVPESCGHQD